MFVVQLMEHILWLIFQFGCGLPVVAFRLQALLFGGIAEQWTRKVKNVGEVIESGTEIDGKVEGGGEKVVWWH